MGTIGWIVVGGTVFLCVLAAAVLVLLFKLCPDTLGEWASAKLESRANKTRSRSELDTARRAARTARHQAAAAHHLAYVEAVQAQKPTYRKQAKDEAQRLGDARRAALDRVANRQARAIGHWRPFFVPVVNGLLRLGWAALILAAVLVVFVVIPKGFIAWNHANTQPHPGTVVAVCDVSTADGYIDTSAGTFYLDPISVDGKPYLTPTAVAKLFHRGQLVEITWHGASGSDSYVSAVKFEGSAPAGSCSNVSSMGRPGPLGPGRPAQKNISFTQQVWFYL